jgi:hypothetical protein
MPDQHIKFELQKAAAFELAACATQQSSRAAAIVDTD